MFDRVSRTTITELVVESADSAVESADSMADSSDDPVKIGLWVRAFRKVVLFLLEHIHPEYLEVLGQGGGGCGKRDDHSNGPFLFSSQQHPH